MKRIIKICEEKEIVESYDRMLTESILYIKKIGTYTYHQEETVGISRRNNKKKTTGKE